jgi:hypothetical protein
MNCVTRRYVIAAIAAVASFPRKCFASGEYIGEVVATWLPDNRKMRLLNAFEYRDPKGRRWPVPAGAIVDGASIPQPFWSVIGGPFEGAYRAASVIHDHWCETRTRTHLDVHQMFYDAMLTSGVGDKKAWLMYQAVLRFGPFWKDPRIPEECQIIDKSYDFSRCARNSTKPLVAYRTITREDLLSFANELSKTADPDDISQIKRQAGELPNRP